jgi:hypothetical protein
VALTPQSGTFDTGAATVAVQTSGMPRGFRNASVTNTVRLFASK